jgi:hypothetical protein
MAPSRTALFLHSYAYLPIERPAIRRPSVDSSRHQPGSLGKRGRVRCSPTTSRQRAAKLLPSQSPGQSATSSIAPGQATLSLHSTRRSTLTPLHSGSELESLIDHLRDRRRAAHQSEINHSRRSLQACDRGLISNTCSSVRLLISKRSHLSNAISIAAPRVMCRMADTQPDERALRSLGLVERPSSLPLN